MKDSLSEWYIDLIKNVSAFTTDNRSNIVKAVKEDLEKIHLPCVSIPHCFKFSKIPFNDKI